MRGFWPLFKRELLVFYATPLAWVLAFAFLTVQGLHFYALLASIASSPEVSDQSPLQAFFGETVILYFVQFMLVIPPLTMRLFAEERGRGTIELLLSAPITPLALVLSKYVAALLTYVLLWFPTLFYVFVIARTGYVDPAVVATSYLGVFLAGAALLAVGTLCSALVRSQFLALILTAFVILLFFVGGLFTFLTKDGTVAHAVATHLSLWTHMMDFSSGIIDSRHVVFYSSATIVPLYVTTRIVDGWRWA
jgi:ABC-2 type transport system permease protein